MNIIIMAGGGGSRLWPLSRHQNPKQFLTLGGDKTLLELSYDRALKVAPADHIYIATIKEYADKIKSFLPEIADDHIFFEPQRRDNAPAFAAVAAQLVELGQGEEPTVFMWADHVFTAEEEYCSDLKKIPEVIKKNPESIALMGHIPTYPETGFGYIEAGEKVEGYEDVYKVSTFKEKPDKATAQTYVDAGRYFWNMGSISARPAYLLEELRKYEPELMESIDAFNEAMKAGDEAKASDAYGTAKKISIDYAVLERTKTIYVVTGDYGWSDVGNWGAVKAIFGIKGDHVGNGHHVHVDCDNNYIYNATTKAISLVGVKDMIVVATSDAILVTEKSQSHKVKDVVAKLSEETDGKKYL